MYEKYKTAALEWVNEVRSEHGLPTLAELPKSDGRPSGYSCPIALALAGLTATGKHHEVYAAKTWWRYLEPGFGDCVAMRSYGPWVVEFIAAYDAGRYPELIADLEPAR